MWIVNIRFQLP